MQKDVTLNVTKSLWLEYNLNAHNAKLSTYVSVLSSQPAVRCSGSQTKRPETIVGNPPTVSLKADASSYAKTISGFIVFCVLSPENHNAVNERAPV